MKNQLWKHLIQLPETSCQPNLQLLESPENSFSDRIFWSYPSSLWVDWIKR